MKLSFQRESLNLFNVYFFLQSVYKRSIIFLIDKGIISKLKMFTLWSGSRYESSSMPKSVKLKLKGGGFVDPDTKLEDKASVHKVNFFVGQKPRRL